MASDQRGTSTQRGYGSDHQKERARWQPAIDAGRGWCAEVICVEASRFIPPGSEWHLAHTPDRSAYRGPAHAACNLSEAGKRGNKIARKGNRVTRERWIL